MGKMEEHQQDIEFICKELVRFAKMTMKEMKSHFEINRTDALCTIPHPSGTGLLICGSQAYDCFLTIAKRHLSGFKDIEKQVRVDDLRNAIIFDFTERFLKRKAEINRQNIDKMLSSALKRVKGKREDLIHYIPCVICEDKSPDEFIIGPVRFLVVEKFLSENSNKFEVERQRIYDEHRGRCQKAIEEGMPEERVATAEGSRKIADGLVDGVLDYLSGFPWIAEVTVPESSAKVSRARAELVVEGALNILRVLIGEYHTRNIMQGGTVTRTLRAGYLQKYKASGFFDFSVSRSLRGASFEDDWYNKLRKAAGCTLCAMEAVLNGLLEPWRCSPIQQRYIDALTWYGQGVTEPQVSAKIIKHVASLERITVTRKREGEEDYIAKTMVERVALLHYIFFPEEQGQHDKWKADAAKVYDTRSRLMHGDYSPLSEELQDTAGLAERITRMALQGAIQFYMYVDHKSDSANVKELEEEFLALRSAVFEGREPFPPPLPERDHFKS